eukprot:6204548-Pleurochrysis_carterae.AAC.4
MTGTTRLASRDCCPALCRKGANDEEVNSQLGVRRGLASLPSLRPPPLRTGSSAAQSEQGGRVFHGAVACVKLSSGWRVGAAAGARGSARTCCIPSGENNGSESTPAVARARAPNVRFSC